MKLGRQIVHWYVYACVFGVLIYLAPFGATTAGRSKALLAGFGLLSIWRYLWAINHYVRALIYRRLVFPKIRASADKAMIEGGRPDLYVVVTSYRIQSAVSSRVYLALLEEAINYQGKVTIVAALTDHADKRLIENIVSRVEVDEKISVVLMMQEGTGKRDAMASALKAISRKNPTPDALVLLMDGDSELTPGSLEKTAGVLCARPDVGAVTTDNRAEATGRDLVKDWYDLRLGQRHILMCSIALSEKLLVLTGRFSMFRVELAVHSGFISALENDYMNHWRLGRIKFLTGDDKSTWFWLLQNRAKMLYVADVQINCLEDLPYPQFLKSSLALMSRWYGNMLRNSGRSILLGPSRIGLFLWLCLVDQRMSIWTSMVGPTFCLLTMITVTPAFIFTYLGWVLLTRALQSSGIGLIRRRMSFRYPFLLYFNQISGALMKVYMTFRLDKQSWTRQGIKQVNQSSGIAAKFLRWETRFITALAGAVFLIAVATGMGLLPRPSRLLWTALTSNELMASTARKPKLQPRRKLATPPTSKIEYPSTLPFSLQSLIDSAKPGETVSIPAGVITIDGPVKIHRSGLVIKGAGIGKTIVKASFLGNQEGIIRVSGEAPTQIHRNNWIELAKPAHMTDTKLTLTGPVTGSFGTYIILRAPNDPALLKMLGATKWSKEFPYLRQTLAKVVGIKATELTLEKPLGFDLPKGSRLASIALVSDVTLKDFTIEYDIGGSPSPNQYENLKPSAQVDGIQVLYAADLTIENIEVKNAGRHPFAFDYVYKPTVRNVSALGAWNKGEGGNGYFKISRTGHGIFENLHLAGLRHLTIQWSSHDNSISKVETDCDVNFHGGFSQRNVVSIANSKVRAGHRWKTVTRTRADAHWAPPDGQGNRVLDENSRKEYP